MSRRFMTTLGITLALTLALGGPALASYSVTVGNLSFSNPGIPEYNAQQSLLQSIPVLWSADAAWNITVESLNPNLGNSTNGGYVKPVSDLQFKLSTNSQWIPMTYGTSQPVNSGAAGSNQFLTDWRVVLHWTQDRPGSYQTQLRFTITPN